MVYDVHMHQSYHYTQEVVYHTQEVIEKHLGATYWQTFYDVHNQGGAYEGGGANSLVYYCAVLVKKAAIDAGFKKRVQHTAFTGSVMGRGLTSVRVSCWGRG